MTRKSLARAIAKKTTLTQRQAENLIIAFGAVVKEALCNGEKIIYSNFGSFYDIEYPSKTINHPKNGNKIIMLPTRVIKWMPSNNLKKAVSGRNVIDDSDEYSDESSDQLIGQEEDQSYAEEIKIDVVKPDFLEVKDQSSKEENIKISLSEPKEEDKKMDKAFPNAQSDQPKNHDNIEEYHSQTSENRQKPVNIFEEILSDGGREFSTVKGSIKAHSDKKEDKENSKQDTDSSLEPQSSSAFNILKNKLGFGKKEQTISQSHNDSTNNPDSEELTPTDTRPNIPVNMADYGIFDKNSAKGEPQKVNIEPKQIKSQNAEQEIDTIKKEISEKTDDQESLPNNSTESENYSQNPSSSLKSDEHSSIFSGAEGSFNFDKAKIEYKDLNNFVVPKELLAKIPENIARSFKSIPFEEKDGVINVAMVDPEDVETREMIKRLLGEKIKLFLTTEADINTVLNQYQGLENEVSSAIATAEEGEEEDEKKDPKKQLVETVSDDAPAAKIVSSLLKRAIRDKASDVHIEPTEKEVEVRFRLDGVLRKKVSLPKDIQASVISRIKILSNMKIDEQRVPQDGRFNMHVDGRRVDFRVSSMPVAFGEKIVMRILDKDSGILTIEQLGINGSGLKSLETNLLKSHGMVLVTGPTGSGKSTSLYAMIQKVYTEGVNIITLEDPIEYQMRGINQSQVNSEIGYTFAAGLRSILRQDPDIIMLGEIRDKETAEMAVHAALTGHVVLSTLHTNDAAGAAPRMIDMGVEPFLITSSINVVIGQRLVRTICEECKEELKLPDEEMAEILKEIEKMPSAEKSQIQSQEIKFYQGKGCKSCDNSGFKGRIGIYEVLNITPEMQQQILKRVSSTELNNLAISQGMVTMIQDGIIKASQGATTMSEVWRATKN